jgi:hypothetical protein
MTSESGIEGFDQGEPGRDAGDQRLDDEAGRRQIGEDAGDGALEDSEAHEVGGDRLNDAFDSPAE